MPVYWPVLQFYPEDGGDVFIQNVGIKSQKSEIPQFGRYYET
jgi:hypothetical protein